MQFNYTMVRIWMALRIILRNCPESYFFSLGSGVNFKASHKNLSLMPGNNHQDSAVLKKSIWTDLHQNFIHGAQSVYNCYAYYMVTTALCATRATLSIPSLFLIQQVN
jgi:hypothetical protein